MELNNIISSLHNAAAQLASGSYPQFTGARPVSIRKAICVTLKRAEPGNRHSENFTFTITLRSAEREELIDDICILKKSLAGNLEENLVGEIPAQDFIIEGVKGASRWVWESRFDITVSIPVM